MNDKANSEWLIWSNEHKAWWAPKREGYTRKRSEAGKYPEPEARLIVRQSNWDLRDEAVPEECMVCLEEPTK